MWEGRGGGGVGWREAGQVGMKNEAVSHAPTLRSGGLKKGEPLCPPTASHVLSTSLQGQGRGGGGPKQ